MKYLNLIGALISLALIAAGVMQSWKPGLSSSGVSAFAAASVMAFCLSLTLQVFTLRQRINALEKAGRQEKPET